MNDRDIPACPQSGPLLELGSSDGLGPGSEAVRLVEYLKGYPHTDGISAAIRVILEQAAEIEQLRAVVAKGRAAYSAYGLLATPPNHDMHTDAGAKLRTEWLRETDDYLHALGPNVEVTGKPPRGAAGAR